MLKDDKANYTYNVFNQTVKVETFDGNVQINRYDAEGLRYEMEENGQLVQFIFNTNREVIAEKENEWTVYIRGSEILASSNDYAKTYYHHATDEMGSITHIVDDKNILNHYEYDALGNVVKQKETVKNRFKFTGEQLDPITQQYYLRARFYNSVIARFTQEDTYRDDGLNLYAYCRNNPVKYIDPTGNACKKPANMIREKIVKGTANNKKIKQLAVFKQSKNVKPFDITKYGDKTPLLENHQGILDIWAKNNIPGYTGRAKNSITIALTKEQHALTKSVYRDWLFNKIGKKVGGKINWKDISLQEIQNLSEKMFDIAGVPQFSRNEYYREFNNYIYNLI